MAYEDATTYFNRTNNLGEGIILYVYAGYISFIQQILAYCFSFLPYLAQSFFYAVTALLVGLWLFYQFSHILIDGGIGPRLAYGIALFAMALLHVVCPNFYLNLTFTIWTALIAASIYVTRIALAGAQPHWVATGMAALGFASHPLAIVSLPVLGAGLYLRRAQLATFGVHAVVLALAVLLMMPLTEASQNVMGVSTIFQSVGIYLASVTDFDAFKLVTIHFPIMFMVAAILLGLARLPHLVRSGAPPVAGILSGSLFLVPAYFGLYLASGRFWGDIHGRYLTPSVAYSVLAFTMSFVGAPWLAAAQRRLERLGRAPLQAVLIVWLVVGLAAAPAIFWKYYSNRLQFLAAAQCMRESRLPGIAIAAEANEWTTVIASGNLEHSTSEPGMAVVMPSVQNETELQRICPGIKSSYLQAVRKARIWIGGTVF